MTTHPIGPTWRAWLQGCHNRDELTAGTIRTYGDHMTDFCRHLGDDTMPVSAVVRTDIESWLGALKARGLAATTRNTRRSTVRQFFAWAVDVELIDVSPATRVKRAKTRRGPAKRLTPEQVAAVIAAADHHNGTRLMVILAVQLFLRRGELAGLKVEAWDRRRGVLFVESESSKGEKSREVPVPAEAAEELAKWLADGRLSGPMWPSSHRAGHGLAARTIGARVTEAGARAGVKVWPHLFRATGLSDAAGQGGSVVALAEVAGHEDPSTTLRHYLWANDGERRQAVEGRRYRSVG